MLITYEVEYPEDELLLLDAVQANPSQRVIYKAINQLQIKLANANEDEVRITALLDILKDMTE